MNDNIGISEVEVEKIKRDMDIIRSFNGYSSISEGIKNLKCVVFNVERGKHLDEIETYMKYHNSLKNADVIFFNELDDGMARTGNIDTTADLSKRLSMNYAFGIEFYELTKGNEKESNRVEEKNDRGYHGNAIMSRFELIDPVLIRLPLAYNWFYNKQKRLGSRIAIFSKIKVNNQMIGLICTHLENRTTPKGRADQMKYILEQAEKHFKDIPVIIAGDMNTNICDGNNDVEFIDLFDNRESQSDKIHFPEIVEPIFKLVEDNGCDYKNANVTGKVSRRKPIAGKGILELNLDWFFVRGLKCVEPAVIKTVFSVNELDGVSLADTVSKEGMEISDHDAISVKCLLNP